MESDILEEIKIENTTPDDLDRIQELFDRAILLQGKKGYRVWDFIDPIGLQKDISEKLQYKIVSESDILCIFSIQHHDPFIWRDRDQNDAIYLHRIVVNQKYKGQKQFQKVLEWAKKFARDHQLLYVRMDTWADNEQIIEYYTSFGFELVEYFTTPDNLELPIQNRKLNVALLELKV